MMTIKNMCMKQTVVNVLVAVLVYMVAEIANPSGFMLNPGIMFLNMTIAGIVFLLACLDAPLVTVDARCNNGQQQQPQGCCNGNNNS